MTPAAQRGGSGDAPALILFKKSHIQAAIRRAVSVLALLANMPETPIGTVDSMSIIIAVLRRCYKFAPITEGETIEYAHATITPPPSGRQQRRCMMSDNLPSYEESQAAMRDLTPTALQRFIYHQTPQFYPETFRYELQAALEEAIATAQHAARRDALVEAAKIAAEYQPSVTFCDLEDDDMLRGMFYDIDVRIRRLIDAPAAQTCPVCGSPMQRGSVWLCVKDGQTVIV